MAQAAPPAAAPPNFYDNLPAGGDAAAGGPQADGGKKMSESDADIEKGLNGIISVLIKMGKVKKEWKGRFDKLKQDALAMLVEIGGKAVGAEGEAPAATDSTPAASAPPSGGGAPPSQTDESHAA
jgi:hypothetical protein